MSPKTLSIMALFFLAGLTAQARPNVETFRIWTVEGELDGALQWLDIKLQEFSRDYLGRTGRNLEIILENYPMDEILERFFSERSNNSLPDLLLTVNDHIGPLVRGRKLLALNTLPGFDPAIYKPETLLPAKQNGDSALWGAPLSYGNQLMLYYNKRLISTPPQNTDDLATAAKALTGDGRFGITFIHEEPFWLVPWLAGYGGKVFQEDGITPNLDSPAMVAALELFRKWKVEDGLLPLDATYAESDDLFKEGSAAMIINGDWALGDYATVHGDNLGIAPLPMVSSTGNWPLPYATGKYFLATVNNQNNAPRLAILSQLIRFFSRDEAQLSMTRDLLRLPVTIQASRISSFVEDPLLNRLLHESMETQKHTTPMPTNVEMRTNWDVMRTHMRGVLDGTLSPAAAAGNMQKDAESILDAAR